MTRAQPEFLLKPKLLAVSVAACFAFNAGAIRANPNAPTVAHGSVGFNGLGTSALTITNQGGGNAVINWNGFSIGINELTKFQQFANLAVLNRVTGSEISSILGALQSDGRVFLINPNGIVFGASARIDVAGMVASSLNLSDQDFLSNRLRFTEVPGAGAVVNNGVIETATGGRVYLVAPTVENNGLIHAKQGEILLAAGKEVELVDGASPFVTVKVTAGTEQALNIGNLVAEGGRIGMFGALVRNSGTVQAGGAMVGPGGEIRLVATKDLTLDAGSLVAANGTSGGKVLLQAEGGTNLVGGSVEARGLAGKGGEIQALGVRVGVVGHGLIDASGKTGGGTVLVGGDYQGKNGSVQNAERTYIGTDGVIRADAMATGDGGRVIVWADGDTRFFGSVSARGGSQSGNGGFVETSGKGSLQAFGAVDTSAPNGKGGTWLLDPGNINIVASNGGPDDLLVTAYGALFFADGQAAPLTSTIGVNSIVDAMSFNGSVVLQATEDITLQASVIVPYYGSLTMQAGDDIHLGAFNISIHGDLSLTAADARSGVPASTGAITSSSGGGNLSTDGGRLDLSGNSVAVGTINTAGGAAQGYGGGAVNINASTGSVSTGSITTGGGSSIIRANVNINALGSIMTGLINTSAGLLASANGDVFLNAGGSISTGSITTRSMHPSHGDGGEVGLFARTGTILVNGNIDTRGSNGVDNGFDSPYYGGTSGGQVTLSRDSDGFAGTGITVLGSILTSGGSGVSADSSFYGNPHNGGNGGRVDFGDWCDGLCGPVSGNIVVTGSINTSGGAGGSTGNESAFTYGGNGGQVDIRGDRSVQIGSIVTSGGSAGAVSSAANGNWGGNGGDININTVGAVSIGSISTSGGHGGSVIGSVYGSSLTSGGAGGWAGWIDITGASISVPGSIAARGGNGGAGAVTGNNFDASGGDGGYGGEVQLFASYGAVVVGSIDTRGGHGGAGGFADSTNFGFTDALGGDGGEGGFVLVDAAAGVSIGSIQGQGGSGGSGGTALPDAEFQVSGNAQGGDGGEGSLVFVSGGGNVFVGTIEASGGSGGNGGVSQDAAGGSGGDGGGLGISGSSVSTGSLVLRGGAGGNGGTVLDQAGGSSGGSGGQGGLMEIVASAGLSTGLIDISGGNGGRGGPVGTDVDFGGSGGDGGYASIYGAAAVTIAGPIRAAGGDGGALQNSSIIVCGECTSGGGDGGAGGLVTVASAGKVQINVGGTLGAVAIDVGGGNGGAGNPSSSPAGNGGSGGNGGGAQVIGTPEMTLFGSVLAAGGDGGAGGAGAGSFPGGSGGQGGLGGMIYLDASSVTNSQLGDGTIFVLAGTAFDINPGLGGAAGANGGSAGAPGTPGSGLFTFFGTIVLLDPLSVPGINEGFQQVVKGGDDTTAFVGGEKEDEEEDKSQKELGSCKG